MAWAELPGAEESYDAPSRFSALPSLLAELVSGVLGCLLDESMFFLARGAGGAAAAEEFWVLSLDFFRNEKNPSLLFSGSPLGEAA